MSTTQENHPDFTVQPVDSGESGAAANPLPPSAEARGKDEGPGFVVKERRFWSDDTPASETIETKTAYVKELEKKIAEMEEKVQQTLTAYRNMQQSQDAFRERLRRDQDQQLQSRLGGMLENLLPVLDNFDRTIEAGEKNTQANALLDGVKLVRAQFEQVLRSLGVERIEAAGSPFNPAEHEAISTAPAPTPEQDGQVLYQARAGYRFGQRLLRPAQVVVARSSS
ncbi:MAG: Protein GrpE [Myxococcota bacterium]|nr:Protein GrpE [Myxococcota bacterium]